MFLENFKPLNYHSVSLSLLPPEKIDFLRTTKVISNNDQNIGKSFQDVLSLEPIHFLGSYKRWLQTLITNFRLADNLSARILNEEANKRSLMEESAALCIKIDDDFKDGFRFPVSVKAYTSRTGDNLTRKYSHLPQELLLTPGCPSAEVWLDLLLQQAASGSKSSMDHLAEYVYLNPTYTSREISRYTHGRLVNSTEHGATNDKVASFYAKKMYSVIERRDLQTLDEILKLDNFDEIIIWKLGLHTTPMWFVYHWVQTNMLESGILKRDTSVPEHVVFIDRILNAFRGQAL